MDTSWTVTTRSSRTSTSTPNSSQLCALVESPALLMLKVDIVEDSHKSLTSAANLPCESRSEQYTRNLGIALSDSSVQIFMDYTVVFLLPNGTISRGAPAESKSSGSTRSGSSPGMHAYQDEQNDVAVGVTLTVPPSPAPTAQIAFSTNQSSSDSVSTQKTSSAMADSYAAWWWSLTIAVGSAVLRL